MPEKIGEKLIRHGILQRHGVQEILQMQEAGDDRLFGEIAIELGYIDEEALARYLEENEMELPSIIDFLTR